MLGYAARCEQSIVLVEGETTHVVVGAPQPQVVQVVGTVHEGGELAGGYTVYCRMKDATGTANSSLST